MGILKYAKLLHKRIRTYDHKKNLDDCNSKWHSFLRGQQLPITLFFPIIDNDIYIWYLLHD